MASIADPLNNVTSFQNDLAGNVIATTDALGRTTRYTYDLMNRLAQVTDSLGGVTRYTYDASGNLTSVHDPHDHITTFLYDSMNRLISSTDPLGRVESYLYDLNGNLIQKTAPQSLVTIHYVYDAANQLLEKRDSLNVTRYSYDLNGNLTSVTDSDSDVSFSYDPLDRVLRTFTTQPVNSVIEYSYDAVGNRLTMKDPQGGVTSYQYDTVNRLLSLSNPESQIWNFQYDLAGRRTRLTHPNGIATTYSYDPASRLISLHHDQGGAPIAHFDYAYDAIGNRIQKGELDGSTGYGYDALNRLTSASTTIPGLPQEFYSYDAVGNRISSYLSNVHVHDTANQLLEDEQFLYSYDPNGNQTGKTAKDGSERWLYTYDAENQLVRVDRFTPASLLLPVMAASYGYDGLGRRITKTVNGVTTKYVLDDYSVLSINGVATVQGPFTDEPLAHGDTFLLHDVLGSVVAEVRGSLVENLRYQSYGEGASPNSPYAFTGREIDAESGLYYYRNRYYDPATGRFIVRDPIGFVGGVNFYRYVSNNPLRWIDPWGLWDYVDEYETSGENLSDSITSQEDTVDKVFQDVSDRDAIVTYTDNGKHGKDSLHYEGEAIDLRTRDLTPKQLREIVDKLKQQLGKDYDVVLENGKEPHIHIEYDPKKKPRLCK